MIVMMLTKIYYSWWGRSVSVFFGQHLRMSSNLTKLYRGTMNRADVNQNHQIELINAACSEGLKSTFGLLLLGEGARSCPTAPSILHWITLPTFAFTCFES